MRYFAIADTLKEETQEAMQKLHELNIRTVILTGDNKRAAAYIAQQAGVDEVVAELMPGHKAELIKSFQQVGDRRHGWRRYQRRTGFGAG